MKVLHGRMARPAVTTAKMTSVVPATVATCRHPSAAIPVSEVPRPNAEIAINSPHVDASINGGLIQARIDASAGNESALLLSAHRATNTTAKSGIGTLAAVLAMARLANNQPIASTTGNIRKTRNNLTITAVLPAVSDTAYPAPTTCATSWIVAPSITPAVCASNSSHTQMSG